MRLRSLAHVQTPGLRAAGVGKPGVMHPASPDCISSDVQLPCCLKSSCCLKTSFNVSLLRQMRSISFSTNWITFPLPSLGPTPALGVHSETPFGRRALASLQVEELVEGDDNPVEDYNTLPDTVPATYSVANIPCILLGSVGSDHSSRPILVLSEYEEAEEAALLGREGPYGSPFVVTGQPEIGRSSAWSPLRRTHLIFRRKTVFLLRLLMRRLALGLPTVFQLNHTPSLLFHEHGICQFVP